MEAQWRRSTYSRPESFTSFNEFSYILNARSPAAALLTNCGRPAQRASRLGSERRLGGIRVKPSGLG